MDEDVRVEEEDPLAGRVIRMGETLRETWRLYFSSEGCSELDDRMNVDEPPETSENDRWKPFMSELDWRVAMWVIREDVGQKAVDRLLSIPGVSRYLIDAPEVFAYILIRSRRV